MPSLPLRLPERIPRRLLLALAVALVLTAVGASAGFLFLGSDPPAPAVEDPEPKPESGPPSHNAEIDNLYALIGENRTALNKLTLSLDSANQNLQVLTEQVTAVLQNQQSLNPAALGQHVSEISESLRDLTLKVDQTRRETGEITELRNSLSITQRQLAAREQQAETELAGIDERLQSIAGELTALRDELQTLTDRVDANSATLADPQLLAPAAVDEPDPVMLLARCRRDQILAETPPGFAPDPDLEENFIAQLQAALDAGLKTEADLENDLDECLRSLW